MVRVAKVERPSFDADTRGRLAMAEITIGKMLVPSDFSDTAMAALRYAVDLADKLQASLTLLYVVEPAVYPAELGVTVNIEGDLLERGRAEIAKLAESACAGRTVQTEVTTGVADLKIIDTAAEIGADLIVMGTHGHTGLAHALLGSTTERVVRKAPCPVLTVRAPQD